MVADGKSDPSWATVKVVGPCKSGKSTLVSGLTALGYSARCCGQEHSEVPTMWQRMAPARWLIYLDVSLETIRARSARADWSEEFYAQQQRRLAHARLHCDVVISTDNQTPEEVLAQAVAFLEAQVAVDGGGTQQGPA
jgi:hypothetical protein